MCWIKLNSLDIITKTYNLSYLSNGNRNTNIKKIKKNGLKLCGDVKT